MEAASGGVMNDEKRGSPPRGFAIFVAVVWLLGATALSYTMPRLAEMFVSMLGSLDKLPAPARIAVSTPPWLYLAEAVLIPAVVIGKEWMVDTDEASWFDRAALIVGVLYVLGSYVVTFLVITQLQRSLIVE